MKYLEIEIVIKHVANWKILAQRMSSSKNNDFTAYYRLLNGWRIACTETIDYLTYKLIYHSDFHCNKIILN